MLIDPTVLTDAELQEVRDLVVQEQDRRTELDLLPRQVDALTQRFVDHGGDKTKLKDPKNYIKTPKPDKPTKPPKDPAPKPAV